MGRDRRGIEAVKVGNGTIRGAIVATLLGLSSAAWCRTQDVSFVAGSNTPAVKLVVQALRQTDPTFNVPLSIISAALVDLNGDGSPELFVQRTGGFCGSGGCSITLFERGTTGWLKIGDWVASVVSVSDLRDAGWLHLVLDHSQTWRYSNSGYQLMR